MFVELFIQRQMSFSQRARLNAPCFSIGFAWRVRWRCCARATQTDSVIIRPARPSDARALSALCMEAFREDKNTNWTPIRALVRYAERGDLTAQFQSRMPSTKRPRHSLLLAEYENKIVGCVEVGILNKPESVAEGDIAREWDKSSAGKTEMKPSTVPYIGNLAVSKSTRRKGLGFRLVDAAEKEAVAWGAESIALHVDALNVAAQKLYRKRGYSCRAREPSWYPKVGRLQRLFLTKSFVEQQERKGNEESYESAPVVHTRPLDIIEYLRWCIFDLRQQAKKV